MKRIRLVMHASDFSSASRPALRKAVEICKSARARLLIIHAVAPTPPLLTDGVYIMPSTWDDIAKHGRRATERRIAKILQRLTRSGVRAEGLIAQGEAAEQIVRVARARDVDILVVGTHGRTAFSRFFLGSVAARVVAMASCPVLTVPARR
jgi:nucleotide-binding universal stress UspA family protein